MPHILESLDFNEQEKCAGLWFTCQQEPKGHLTLIGTVQKTRTKAFLGFFRTPHDSLFGKRVLTYWENTHSWPQHHTLINFNHS